MHRPIQAAPPDRAALRRLGFGFALLTALTYGLIVLGALVRAHHAGLACPDWPLCFGRWVPAIDLRVAFEWGHRVSAGSIGILFLMLSTLTLRDARRRERLSGPIAIAAALLALQILLGGLTVLHLLASWTVTAHLLTGNAFALTLGLSAATLFEFDRPADEVDRRRPIPAGLRALLGMAALLLGTQVLLGGLVSSRYAGLACSEWPSCEAGVWIPSWSGAQGLQILHRFNAYALLLALAGSVHAARTLAAGSGLRRLVGLCALLGLAQVGVGVANVLLRLPVEVTGLHTGLAGLLILTLALALRASWQRPLATTTPVAGERDICEGSTATGNRRSTPA